MAEQASAWIQDPDYDRLDDLGIGVSLVNEYQAHEIVVFGEIPDRNERRRLFESAVGIAHNSERYDAPPFAMAVTGPDGIAIERGFTGYWLYNLDLDRNRFVGQRLTDVYVFDASRVWAWTGERNTPPEAAIPSGARLIGWEAEGTHAQVLGARLSAWGLQHLSWDNTRGAPATGVWYTTLRAQTDGVFIRAVGNYTPGELLGYDVAAEDDPQNEHAEFHPVATVDNVGSGGPGPLGDIVDLHDPDVTDHLIGPGGLLVLRLDTRVTDQVAPPTPDMEFYGGVAFGHLLATAPPREGETERPFGVTYTLRPPRYRYLYELPDPPSVPERPVVRQYPRDDGRGLSASPRIHPPPKAHRIVGGHQ